MNEVVNEVVKGLTGIAILWLTPMAAKAIARWRQKHEHDLLGQLAEAIVRAIEQQATKEKGGQALFPDGSAKLKAARAQLQAVFPVLSVGLIDAETRAAVARMNLEKQVH